MCFFFQKNIHRPTVGYNFKIDQDKKIPSNKTSGVGGKEKGTIGCTMTECKFCIFKQRQLLFHPTKHVH